VGVQRHWYLIVFNRRFWVSFQSALIVWEQAVVGWLRLVFLLVGDNLEASSGLDGIERWISFMSVQSLRKILVASMSRSSNEIRIE
jgi:hypothetical protein